MITALSDLTKEKTLGPLSEHIIDKIISLVRFGMDDLYQHFEFLFDDAVCVDLAIVTDYDCTNSFYEIKFYKSLLLHREKNLPANMIVYPFRSKSNRFRFYHKSGYHRTNGSALISSKNSIHFLFNNRFYKSKYKAIIL